MLTGVRLRTHLTSESDHTDDSEALQGPALLAFPVTDVLQLNRRQGSSCTCASNLSRLRHMSVGRRKLPLYSMARHD